MNQSNSHPPAAINVGRNRAKLLLVAGLFFLPAIAATVLYVSGWRPRTQVNYGDLVQPARPIQDVTLQTLDGSAHPFSATRGKWLMIYFGPSSCDVACAHDLYKMRQVQIAQGKDADRIALLFVITNGAAPPRLLATLKDYPDMRVVTGPSAAVTALARQFYLPAGSPLNGLNLIYVVDPLGNLMMSYPPDADPSRMRKDFVRLLQVSQVG